ncbi:hypothetical protein NE237_013688 [Protea cynaroides]|uniref:Major facilitator superfamily (MFS) profile domain-containing protein n=1 Tax=Protea cynaroides TaxID=273540 RepID=A0A9Q0H2J8_9MAGN|nr:hypothetical protein NE237_013688 [Protea cynaroides]
MRLSSTICTIGWLAIYLAKVPVFIAEIVPKNLQGVLATANRLLMVIGLSTAFIVGGFELFLVFFYFLASVSSQSPQIVDQGWSPERVDSLRALRGKNANISHEETEIQDYIETLEHFPNVTIKGLFQKKYIRSVIVGVGLMVVQQVGGVNGIMFHASQIFVSAGACPPCLEAYVFISKFLSDALLFFAPILQIVVTVLGAALIDGVGRRPLLMVSASGLLAGSLLIGVAFFLRYT